MVVFSSRAAPRRGRRASGPCPGPWRVPPVPPRQRSEPSSRHPGTAVPGDNPGRRLPRYTSPCPRMNLGWVVSLPVRRRKTPRAGSPRALGLGGESSSRGLSRPTDGAAKPTSGAGLPLGVSPHPWVHPPRRTESAPETVLRGGRQHPQVCSARIALVNPHPLGYPRWLLANQTPLVSRWVGLRLVRAAAPVGRP